jgi:glutamine amidotransferase
MIAIVDYEMGNLRSVQKALEKLGHGARIVAAADQVEASEKLILPGVGAFGDAMANLRKRELVEPIRAYIAGGRPFLGICLGLQLLFEEGEEDGRHEGLGVLRGRVVRFRRDDPAVRIPHMGWNALSLESGGNPLWRGLPERPHVYFVHAYYAEPAEEADVAATAEHGGRFCASVWRDNVWAMQFHPEKSQRVGLTMLDNFARL